MLGTIEFCLACSAAHPPLRIEEEVLNLDQPSRSATVPTIGLDSVLEWKADERD
jgi:hypothetical protein